MTCLLKFFDSRLRAAQGRFTADGRSYLVDISRAYICYSYHTSGKGKATWWPGKFGEYYWKYHANRLAVAFNQLVEDDPQRMLNGRDVRDAMADIGRTFKAALTRRLRTLSLEELQTVVTNREVEEDEADDPDSWRAQRIQEILSGCPI